MISRQFAHGWARTAGLAFLLLVTPISAVEPAHAAGQTQPAYQTLTSPQLAAMLQQKDFAFINVHIPYEGEIAQTDAFIPFDRIGENMDRLPADKKAAVVLYCMSGRMSEIAANELARLGYTNVSHLQGGMVGWAAAGHKVLQGE